MSTVETLLEQQHGDLHEVIPRLASELGQSKAANVLSVNQAWLSRWLRENDYIKVTQYIKASEMQQAS